MRYLHGILGVALLLVSAVHPAAGQHAPYIQYLDHPWVDSVAGTLSVREQAAQLVWVTSSAKSAPSGFMSMYHLITTRGIGGLVFNHCSERDFRNMMAYCRSGSPIPIAAGIIRGGSAGADPGSMEVFSGEMGQEPAILERFQSDAGQEPAVLESFQSDVGQEPALLEDFPGAMVLNAVSDSSLLSRAGQMLASRLVSLGIQVLVDREVETGAGETPLSQMLPEHRVLTASLQYPDREGSAMEQELAGIPGFRGIISADHAGTEGLAFLFDLDEYSAEMAIGRIESLVEAGSIDPEIITQRARMMLAFKYWAGLHNPGGQGVQQQHGLAIPGVPPWNRFSWKAMIRDLYAGALTVLNNRGEVIPIRKLESTRVATVAVHQIAPAPTPFHQAAPTSFHQAASTSFHQAAPTPFQQAGSTFFHQAAPTPFQQMAGNYTRMDHYQWFPGMEPPDSLLEKLQEYDLVLAAIYPGNTHLSMETVEKLTDYSAGDRQLVVVSFDGAVDQGPLPSMWREAEGLVNAYQHNLYTEELAAQLLFGGIGARGRLPVAAGEDYPAGSGINTQGELRLQYAYPENAGFSSRVVQRSIDSIVHAGLVAGAFPGCEIMAARQGKVIFHKTYGHHTYNRRIAVSKQDLYDLASVTKISGPLSGLMVLEGMGRFSHRDQLGTYAHAMKRSDKADLWLKEVLAHQAGLYPWIPYWRDAVRDNGKYRKRFLRYTGDHRYPVVVAEHLYLKHNFKRRIYRTIRKSELGEKEYLYSGLAFFLFPEIIEDLSGDRYEDFLYRQVYHRIGAWDLVFNPWRSYPGSQIVPTEYDSLFRKQQVHGYVHDEGAAMMGGYSGNAGLFATANDLMKLMEMYRRMGSYGGEEIIPAGVLQEYTSYQFPVEENRRGLGFDKPLLGERDGTPGDYPCPGASPSSFGHSGFTGTFAWVDPEYEITYVFLSNRVYPTRENNLISEMDIRTSILQSLYDAIDSGE